MSYFLPQAQRQHIACISLPGALCYHSWTTSNPEIAWICLCSTRLYRVGILSKDLKLQLPQVCPSSHTAKSHFPETESWVCSGSDSSLWMLFRPSFWPGTESGITFVVSGSIQSHRRGKMQIYSFFKLIHIRQLQTYLFLSQPFLSFKQHQVGLQPNAMILPLWL